MNGPLTLIAVNEMLRSHDYDRGQSLIRLHAVSDLVIALSYFSFPLILLALLIRRKNIKFTGVAVVLALFIIAGTTTRWLEVYAAWHPANWLSGGIQALTALAFVSTAFLFIKSAPKALIPSDSTGLAETDRKLQVEIEGRKRSDLALRRSQQMVQQLFDLAPEATVVVDHSGLLVQVNARTERLFGQPRDELVGKNIQTLLAPRCCAEFGAQLKASLSLSDAPAPKGPFELFASRKEGQEFLIEVTVSSIETGEGLRAFVIVRDLAERKELEMALVASDARFRTLFDSVPVSLWVTDWSETLRALDRVRAEASVDWAGWLATHPEFVDEAFATLKIKDVNPATLRVFGAKQKEEIYRSLKTIFAAEEARRHFIEALCASERGGTFTEYQTTLNSIEGSPMDMFQTATFLKRESGSDALLSLIDTTAVRRIEQERDQFFELSHDLFSIRDSTGCYSRLNPAWEKTLGYSRGELLGKCGGDLVHPDDLKIAQRVKEDVLKGAAAHSFELRMRCKDGSYRWILGNAVSDQDKQRIYFSGRDITKRKANEQEIQNLNAALRSRAEELERMNGEMESFSYSVSHDLRAPLRHISSFAKILTEDQGSSLEANGLRYIGIISAAAKQMGQLIDDVLTFSSTSRSALSLGEVDNDRLVAEIIHTGHYENGERSIEWKIDSLGTVQADASMLRQVWTNLIENAVKYSSKEDRSRITINRTVDPVAREHVFSVRDNGVGFDMELVGKLFSPFQRLHRAAEFEGSGIGLANVRRIVERHGGRSWAEGKVGEGATIYFSLPFLPIRSRAPFSHSLSTANSGSSSTQIINGQEPTVSGLLGSNLYDPSGVHRHESTFALAEVESARSAPRHFPSAR